jgi:hypothetical protein
VVNFTLFLIMLAVSRILAEDLAVAKVTHHFVDYERPLFTYLYWDIVRFWLQLCDWVHPKDIPFTDNGEATRRSCRLRPDKSVAGVTATLIATGSFGVICKELRFAGLRRLENGFPFNAPNYCRDEKLRERVRSLIRASVPPVSVDKLFEQLKDGMHEVVDGPLVELLTTAQGDLQTIHVDWASMGLPDPTIEFEKFLSLFDPEAS